MFLDFISYSGGPLPEDLLEVIKVPVVIAWGDQDPWEPIEQGRAFADFDSVEVKQEHATLYIKPNQISSAFCGDNHYRHMISYRV